MGLCPVCGCKTEELDFINRKIENTECKVCSFCDRQIGALEMVKKPTEVQMRWLNAVIDKDVSARDESVSSFLNSLRLRFPEEEKVQPVAPSQTQVSAVMQQSDFKKVEKSYGNNDAIINELQNRITVLENELRLIKRKQMIKTIIELGAPVALMILLVIIVLASGLIDNFKLIFEMAGISL